MKWQTLSIAVPAVLVVMAPALRAEDANDAYTRVYAQDARKLKFKDYAAFGQRLLQDAAGMKDDPALEKLLVTKAGEFFVRSTAGEDKTRLGDALVTWLLAAGDALWGDNKLPDAIASYQDAVKIANANRSEKMKDISARIKAVQALIDAQKKLAGLLDRWKAKPDGPALAKEIVLLYVTELDKPAEAAPYLSPVADEGLKTYAPLAAKDANALEDSVLKELAAWYEGLAKNASPSAKIVTLGKARDLYGRFLAKHEKGDADHLTVSKALEGVEKQLELLTPLGASMAKGARTISLDLGKGIAIPMVLIPAGRFVMGSPEDERDRSEDEGPQRLVTISKPFYMSATEITQEQYAAVTGKESGGGGFSPGPKRARHSVTWNDAQDFCKKISEKFGKAAGLPTEAQWEYACRAATTTTWFFGDQARLLKEYAWTSDNAEGKVHNVGEKKPNPAGLYDMYGNVWEWCSDWYEASYYRKAKDADPQGPPTGTERVVRGGCWGGSGCRSAARGHHDPTKTDGSYGFRIVCPAGAN